MLSNDRLSSPLFKNKKQFKLKQFKIEAVQISLILKNVVMLSIDVIGKLAMLQQSMQIRKHLSKANVKWMVF